MSFHLDRRAASLAAQGAGDPDELLDTMQTAAWLGLSHQWLEAARSRGDGPRFVRLTPRRIRYRRSDVLAFLEARAHRRIEEYTKQLCSDAEEVQATTE